MSKLPSRLLQELSETGPSDIIGGRFSVESEVGIGGMGLVYRARDLSVGGPVALKILRNTDDSSRRRFETEIAALERLSHPAIVSYVAHGTLRDGEPFLAMEWVEGESLGERLKRGTLSVVETVVLGLRILAALAEAHALGIVHRDLKPGNVLLPEGRVDLAKLSDFGISRLRGTPHVTTTGMGLGTPGYAAPEQVRGVADLDERADLFSLGCLLFRCLTNIEAFTGAEPLTVIAKLLLEEPPPVSSLRADVPRQLDEVIARLLAKERAERPASAQIVMQELEELNRRLPGELAALADSAPIRNTALTGARGLWERRGLWVLACCSMSLLVALLWLLRHKGSDVTTPVVTLNALKPGRTPVLVSDVPASERCSPEAVQAYRRGLRALREATHERAHKAFEEAMAKDPNCPEALLRVLQTAEGVWPVTEQREHLQRVREVRDQLRERDRLLLDSRAAMLTNVPPDSWRAAKILREGARRFPEDVELSHLAAYSMTELVRTAAEMVEVQELAERVVQQDPLYARAWQVLGWVHARLGRKDQELSAYLKCLDTSPAAVDCMRDRISNLRRRGLCEETAAVAWQWMARDPSTFRAYRLVASALSAEGAARETLEEVLRMHWAHLPEKSREIVRLHDTAKLAAWFGNFNEALAASQQLARLIADDPHVEPHVRAARTMVDALLEMGRGVEAAKEAELVLKRKVAWTDSMLSGDHIESGAAYYEANLLGVMVEQGVVSTEVWAECARSWENGAANQMNPFETWVLRYGSAVGVRGAGQTAVHDEPQWGDEVTRPLPTLISFYTGLLVAYEGRLRLLAGQADVARPLLQSAAHSCQGIDHPFLNTRAYLWLGQTEEKLGNQLDACTAYAVVTRRWGHALPRSITAEQAAQRSQALGCSDSLTQ